MESLDGFFNVDKPSGPTSRRIVDRVGRLLGTSRVGHAGTLDPLASGVLVVGVGRATRLVEFVQRMPKTYEAAFLLGRTSDTEDVEGTVVELPDAPRPTMPEVAATLGKFVGKIQQRPPAFSALKVGGRRAYDLARRGRAVELAPREVEVYGIDLLGYEYPGLRLRIRCGSGTYVRSLGRDAAESLGTGAVMSALRRTAIGRFTHDTACDVEQLKHDEAVARLQPLRRAVETLPTTTVDDASIRILRFGRAIACPELPAVDEAAAVDAAGRLVALLKPKEDGRWAPSRNFA